MKYFIIAKSKSDGKWYMIHGYAHHTCDSFKEAIRLMDMEITEYHKSQCY